MLKALLLVVFMLGLGLTPGSLHAQRMELTPVELLTLPKYCWGRHVDPRYKDDPAYNIPRSCGKRMNHLCRGHMDLIVAQRITEPKGLRSQKAGGAIQNFKYTLSDLPAECPLRHEIEASLAMATMLQRLLK